MLTVGSTDFNYSTMVSRRLRELVQFFVEIGDLKMDPSLVRVGVEQCMLEALDRFPRPNPRMSESIKGIDRYHIPSKILVTGRLSLP